MIKFSTNYGVEELREDQVAARECYIAMLEMDDHQQTMCIGEQRVVAESVEELQEVILDDSRPERTTIMGTLASWPVRQTLTTVLRDNQDVFAWSHKDIPGIDPSIIVHRLNVSPSFSPIWQKKQVFAQEWDKTIAEEVRKLLEADFIQALIDSIARHQLLSFMDAFSRYNQIKMEEDDQEKTFFVTSEGLFCYKVMPFRLKNAGVTY